MRRPLLVLVTLLLALPASADVSSRAYDLPAGGGSPHDVAVSADGIVWYTAQRDGKLGRLDPVSGKVELIPLGQGAAPHGVIVGPDGAPWVTEGGTNSIVRVDPKTREVKRWPLPPSRA
ncbi:MAG TPA: lyase, partial [Methylomirabilota bacterium]|nr:lyase [Methylomirabilota bacterium]